MNIEELKQKCDEFKDREKRSSFYDMAVDLLNKKLEIPAMIIILSIWNIGAFRFKVTTFDLDRFKAVVSECIAIFAKLKDKSFETIGNFEEIADDTKKIYNLLSQIDGVKYTGASKIMHLKNRNLFIMWDGYIRGEKTRKYYNDLEVVRKGYWRFKKYPSNADGYLEFLADMKEMFKDVGWQTRDKVFFRDKTFVKAIDEFNYVSITLPIKEKEKQRKQKI